VVTYFDLTHILRYFERLTKSTIGGLLKVSAMPVGKYNSLLKHYTF
jgi:hypothetical protein